MSEPQTRTHIVMIPGFGGFDVLGQIFYYAGVTASFNRWKGCLPAEPAAHRVALHYFDNLPTAGVRSRAMKLRAYLEERIYRADFGENDRIALVGHSTGGLDIRQLAIDLNRNFDLGLRSVAEKRLVSDEEILGKISRLVFLSVPQRGTNIADFTRRFRMPIMALAEQTELGLRASQIELFEQIDRWLWAVVSKKDRSPEILSAIRDALIESFSPDSAATPRDRYAAALARNAYYELLGWIQGVKADFFAIDDLACEALESPLPSPARHDEATRAEECEAWKDRGILTRSYATIGRPPYDQRPRTEPYRTWELPQLLGALGPDRSANTDWVYRFAYAATAAGVFAIPPDNDKVLDDGTPRRIETWENDGIVNTGSMLWPNGEATHLVHGDHGDIIGHYGFRPAVKASETVVQRRGHNYDLLGSDSGFDSRSFDAVWWGVFRFCLRDDPPLE
jgi:triacylglycerol lipase